MPSVHTRATVTLSHDHSSNASSLVRQPVRVHHHVAHRSHVVLYALYAGLPSESRPLSQPLRSKLNATAESKGKTVTITICYRNPQSLPSSMNAVTAAYAPPSHHVLYTLCTLKAS